MDEDFVSLEKEDVIKLLQVEKQKNKQLHVRIKAAQEHSAFISKEVEAEEEYISNKLMKRLSEVQREKENIIKKVALEEENIQNNLHKKLKEVLREKVDIENQLEVEQEYILNKLSKQLKDAISMKDALQKKLEIERKAKEALNLKIEQEEKLLKITLQKKLDQVQKEKVELESQREQEEELLINKLHRILGRIVSEKNELEMQLAAEVFQKQELILALEKEKETLTIELQKKIKEIRHEKHKIKKTIKARNEFYDSTTTSAHMEHPSKAIGGMFDSEKDSQASENEARSKSKGRIEDLRSKLDHMSRNPEVTPTSSTEPTSDRRANKPPMQTPPNLTKHRQPNYSKGEIKEPIPCNKFEGLKEQNNPLEEEKIGEHGDENIEIGKYLDVHDERLELLKRDKKYYDSQNRKMMQKIVNLTTQLEEAKNEAARYKVVFEDLNLNKFRGPVGNAHQNAQLKRDLDKSVAAKYKLDSSMDSLTESSVLSLDSSFSERSFTNYQDLRGSSEYGSFTGGNIYENRPKSTPKTGRTPSKEGRTQDIQI